MNGEESHSREKLSWIVIAAFWPAIGIAFLAVGLFSDPATFDSRETRQLFLDWMTWVQWSLFAVPILLIARWILRHASAVPAVALHVLIAAGFTLLHLTTYLLLVELVRGPDPAGLPGILAVAAVRLPRHLLYNPLIYGAIVLAGYAVHQYWYREVSNHEKALMERLVAEAELDQLRARVRPSFVVATLAAISSLVDEDATRAEDAILRLSDYLRLCLKYGERQYASVGEEVVVLRAWLDVLKVATPVGHGGTVVVDTSALHCLMPPAFLQVLVDYAIGIARNREFDLEISRQGGRLSIRMHIETLDEGLTSSPELTSVQSVLKRAYGSRFGLSHRFQGGATDLEFSLPVLQEDAASTPEDPPGSEREGELTSVPWSVPELQR